jgi:two-component system cell cycle sensor histidine kinase/response regulator CckA
MKDFDAIVVVCDAAVLRDGPGGIVIDGLRQHFTVDIVAPDQLSQISNTGHSCAIVVADKDTQRWLDVLSRLKAECPECAAILLDIGQSDAAAFALALRNDFCDGVYTANARGYDPAEYVRAVIRRKRAFFALIAETAALRKQEQRFRAVSSATSDLVYDWDVQQNTTWWSDGVRVLLGREPEEMGEDTSTWYDFMHPDDRDRVMETIYTAINEQQETWSNEYRYRRADGEYRHVFDRAQLTFADDGTALRMIGAMTDVTEHNRFETELRASEERYRTLVLAASQMVWSTDAEGVVVCAQPFWQSYTGQSDEEVLGVGWANAIHPVYVSHVLDSWQKAVQNQSEFAVECSIRSKTGEFRNFAIRGTALRDARGSIYEWILTGIDITERLHLEAQLLQSQKMEAIGRLAGGIAHDFNNILSAIIGYADFALESVGKDAECYEDIRQIISAAQRAAALTQQLLAFARKQIIQPRVVDLRDMLRRLDSMLRRLIGEDVEFAIEVPDAAGRVKIDPGKFEQVLVNLVVNARDAMPKGGRLKIEVADAFVGAKQARSLDDIETGRYVLLSISDTGSGMTDEVRERAFEPFFTTKPQPLGTGLGLSTCYGIVRQASGAIAVESVLGVGTTFQIFLPRVDAEPTPKPESATQLAARGDETLLVVEDEPLVRALLERTLRQAGFHVLAASNGEEGIEVSRNFAGPIALLITDVIMPVLGGKETADVLVRERPSLRVLYISGYTGSAIQERGVIEERVDFLAKPFTPAQLLRSVRHILDTSGFDT